MPGVFVSMGGGSADLLKESQTRVLLQAKATADALRSAARFIQAPESLAGRQLLALDEIARSPGLGVTALAAALGVRRPAARQVVHALARRHLIEVVRDGRDRRAVQIHASNTGLALVQAEMAALCLPAGLSRPDGAALGEPHLVQRRLAGVL